MYKGVFEGKKVNSLNKRILILGESHHDDDENDDFTTQSVLGSYKHNPTEAKYKFFWKIANSFGFYERCVDDEFHHFWDYVYFGNYIDSICGIKTSKAKHLANKNRKKYNDDLFQFINENDIEYVFVFSRLVYEKMPSIDKKHNKEWMGNVNNQDLFVANKRDWISKCEYKRNCEHKYTTIELNHDLVVYNMRHPSAKCGFNAENYVEVLSSVFKEII
ncbi:MAG: hypothetical protein IKF64_08120 [Eubacterium sp.]|nr:hypothetical protein [Eubacterium sp.]